MQATSPSSISSDSSTSSSRLITCLLIPTFPRRGTPTPLAIRMRIYTYSGRCIVNSKNTPRNSHHILQTTTVRLLLCLRPTLLLTVDSPPSSTAAHGQPLPVPSKPLRKRQHRTAPPIHPSRHPLPRPRNGAKLLRRPPNYRPQYRTLPELLAMAPNWLLPNPLLQARTNGRIG
jgi:hypothetical protein